MTASFAVDGAIEVETGPLARKHLPRLEWS
jgi:hypothetical protein